MPDKPKTTGSGEWSAPSEPLPEDSIPRLDAELEEALALVADLRAKKAAAEAQKRARIVFQHAEAMHLAEITFDELEACFKAQGWPVPKSTPDTDPPPPPKYRNPANHKEVWSGRGAEPAWATPHRLQDKPRVYGEAIHADKQRRR